MADGVIIEGFGPGASEWASEETQEAILKVLESIGKLTKDQNRKIAQKGKAQDPDKLLTGLKKEAKETEGAMDALEKQTKETTKSSSEFSKAMGHAARDTALAATTLIVGGIAAVGMAYADQLSMTLDLNSAGMNLISSVDGVQSGLSTFTQAATDANLTFGQLIDLQKKYGHVLNIYGIQRFAKTSKAFDAQLKGLGFTADESAEFLAEYAEQQRYFSGEQIRTGRLNIDAAIESARTFDAWSKVLGKSRKDLLKETYDSQKQSVDMGAFFQKMQEKGFKGTEDAMAKLKVSMGGVGDEMMDFIASRAPNELDFFGPLSVAAGDTISNWFEIRRKAMNGEAILQADVDKALSGFGSRTNDIAHDMGESGKYVKQMNIDARQAVIDNKKVNRVKSKQEIAELKSAAKLTDSRTKLVSMFERTVGSFSENTDFLDRISDALESFINSGAIEKIQNAFIVFIQKGLPAMASIVEWVFGLAESIADSDVTIGSVIAKGFAAMFLGRMVVGAAAGAIGKGMKGLFDAGKVAGGGAKLGGIGAIGKGLIKKVPWIALGLSVMEGFGDAIDTAIAGGSFLQVIGKMLGGIVLSLGDSLGSMVAHLLDGGYWLTDLMGITDGTTDISKAWNDNMANAKDSLDWMLGTPNSGSAATTNAKAKQPEPSTIRSTPKDNTSPASKPGASESPSQTTTPGMDAGSKINTSIDGLAAIMATNNALAGQQLTAIKNLAKIQRNSNA